MFSRSNSSRNNSSAASSSSSNTTRTRTRFFIRNNRPLIVAATSLLVGSGLVFWTRTYVNSFDSQRASSQVVKGILLHLRNDQRALELLGSKINSINTRSSTAQRSVPAKTILLAPFPAGTSNTSLVSERAPIPPPSAIARPSWWPHFPVANSSSVASSTSSAAVFLCGGRGKESRQININGIDTMNQGPSGSGEELREGG